MAAVAEEQNGNGNVEEEMDDVEKEIIQGRSGGVKGIIFPPPDIRAVVDKTAQWCVRWVWTMDGWVGVVWCIFAGLRVYVCGALMRCVLVSHFLCP